MELYIFKTNIQNKKNAKFLDRLFKQYPVNRWTIDIEDVDKVLRIEASDSLFENELIQGIQQAGYSCEVLDY